MPSSERSPLDLLLVCLVSLALLASAGAQLDMEARLASVCQDTPDSANIIFTSPAQVLELIRVHESLPDICQTRKYDAAFMAMKSLLDQSVLEDICSYETYKKLRAFHLDFLHYYKPEFNRRELLEFDETDLARNPIPESLRRFFILFAKQINSSCKQQIEPKLKQLVEEKRLIGEDEFALMKKFKKESGRLLPLGKSGLRAMKEGARKRGLFSTIFNTKAWELTDLEILDFNLYEKENQMKNGTNEHVDDDNHDDGMKLYVLVKYHDRLKQIHDTCESKLRPIYEEVFAPVIRLNGLAYVDHLKSTHEDQQMELNPDLARWLNIIEACEVMKDLEVLHDSTPIKAIASIILQSAPRRPGQDQSEWNRVKLMSRREAEEFKARLEGPINGVAPIQVEHVKVKFTPRMWLTERKDIDKELHYHKKDLKRILANRKSYVNDLVGDVTYHLRSFFYKHKKEISDRDQSSLLGQLTAFAERHQMSIRLVMTLVAVIFVAVHVG